MNINVTLIFSRHEEGGFCTSDRLKQIIDHVSPDVIFEELSHSNYYKAYVQLTLNNLESVAIKKYLNTKDVKHIAVDTFDLPKDYYKNLDYLHNKMLHRAGHHSFQFRNFLDKMISLGNQQGFSLFNSDQNDRIFESMDILKERILNFLNDESLNRLSLLEKEVIVKREDVILENVYKYSKENEYTNGLMFVGSGHRKSILEKITHRMNTEDIKINWRFYSDLESKLK